MGGGEVRGVSHQKLTVAPQKLQPVSINDPTNCLNFSNNLLAHYLNVIKKFIYLLTR